MVEGACERSPLLPLRRAPWSLGRVTSPALGRRIQGASAISIQQPFLVAAADRLAELARVVGPIGVAGAQRAGLAHSLGPAAEPEGVIGPITGRHAGLAKAVFRPLLQRRRSRAVRRRRTGSARDRGE